MAWLILFGLLHAHLLWYGDVLYTYGMCGLVVFLLRKLKPGWLIALDEALEKLSHQDPVKAKLVTMRYFGGMTIEQASEMLGISRVTAHRYWTFSRAWLHQEITGGSTG